jgi:integral membrane protein
MNDAESTGRGVDHRVVARRVLIRYRVMAYTTAVLLIVLVFVGIPLQVFAGQPDVVKVVGTLHGYLYLVYLWVALDLTRKLRVPLGPMLLVLLAGTVPFCAFVAERWLTRRYERSAGPAPDVAVVDQTGR